MTGPNITPELLRQFFTPKSVALVGVSDRNEMARQVQRNTRLHDFAGTLHYVNPTTPEVLGERTVPSLSAIDRPVDLAFVFLGGDRVLDLVEEAAATGIRNVVILSGGFHEAGAEGRERQRRLVELAARHDQLVLGPNTIGFIRPDIGACFYGSRTVERVASGPVGVASQSGVILTIGANSLRTRVPGFSVLAGVANESVIAIDHMIDYFVDDEDTRVICLFLETVRSPERFKAAALRALNAGKPIVALSGGRTAPGARTAVGHTGAMVGDYKLHRAALDELGVISVRTLEELQSTVSILANHAPARGRRTAFASVSGGLCELFADHAVEAGLELPELAPTTTARLREILPSFASVGNPLDYTGVGRSDITLLPRVVEVLAEDPNVDLVAYSDLPASMIAAHEGLLEECREVAVVAARAPVPVLPVANEYADSGPGERALVTDFAKPVEIGGIDNGTKAIANVVWWSAQRAAPRPPTGVEHHPRPVRDTAEVPGAWSEHEVLSLLRRNGVPVVPYRLCTTADDAVDAAAELGGGDPVAVKVCSAEIAHKSAVGGVVLGVSEPADVRAAFAAVVTAARERAGVEPQGALVAPMRPPALELICSVTRDPTWGLMLIVGFGGVWAETLGDVAVATLPAGPDRIRRLLLGLRMAAMFDGGHGLLAANIDAVVKAIDGVAGAALELGDELGSLEVNPLRVAGDVVEALDGLVEWSA
ncbi:MAG: CoA-binding protein [Pseudonocardiaceae bacterium]|nr:MAG: CoA-binding protein [Pseudonocardiaceae bacterium]